MRSSAGEANPLQLIKDALPRLNGAMHRVALMILESPDDAARASITKLAERADTSAATITRLSTSLGYGGFPALRAAIAMEHGRDVQAGWNRDIGTKIGPTDPPDEVLNVLAGSHATALRNAIGAIDLMAVTRLADQIAVAGRIHIFGDWADAIPAEELHIRLLRIGRPCWFHRGGRESLVAAGLVGDGDVALVLSRSGDHRDAAEFLRRSAAAGAMTAVITGMPKSPLAKIAEVVIDTGTKNGPAWTDFFAGRASDALAAGLLWVLVAQRVPDSLSGAHLDLEPEPALRQAQGA